MVGTPFAPGNWCGQLVNVYIPCQNLIRSIKRSCKSSPLPNSKSPFSSSLGVFCLAVLPSGDEIDISRSALAVKVTRTNKESQSEMERILDRKVYVYKNEYAKFSLRKD